MKLKLKKDIIENKELSNNAIITYIGLVSCLKSDYDSVYTNKNMISYYLTKRKIISRRFEESLRNGLKELIEKNIVICNNKNGTDYFMELKNIKLDDKDKFIFVNFEDIQKILSSSYQGKNGLLRFYICLLGTFISKNKIKDIRERNKYDNILGMMSQEYLAEISNISIHTVIEYTKILEELKLLYISRCSFKFKDKAGKIKKHNNIYGRYEDKDLIDEFANIRYKMYDDLHKVQNINNINNARSLTQKYNHMIKGTKYDKATVAAIYKYISKYNEKYPKKAKDMSIFKEYGYKVEN